MRRTVPTVFVPIMFGVLFAATTFLTAQEGGRAAPPPPPALEPGASQADVDKAVLALPAPNLRNQATVIKWNPDFTYMTLRKGTNTLVCYDRSGKPGHPAFSVECTNMANLERATQNLKTEAEGGGDRMKTAMLFDALEKSGKRVKPGFGTIWYHLEGADQATARPHQTVAVPGATQASLGLPENGRGGGVWIMDAGTSTAHLMTPGE